MSQASQVYCRPSAKQFVFLNNTYGGIFIAHFRPTQELAGSSADRSFALKEVVRSTAVAATQEEYGRCSLSRSPAMPYSVTPLLGIGDIALIVAQTSVRLYDMPPTSLACDGRPNSFTLTEPVSSDGCSSTSRSSRFDGVQIPDDLHGLTLGKNLPSLRSFMASENVSTCLPISTLSVHGVLRAKQGGYARISTLVSGLTGYGGIVIPNGGHILALTFSPLEQLTSPALLLADAGQVSFPPTQLAKTVPSNGAPAPPPVASFQIDLPAGAQLWVAGSSIIAPTSGDNVCSSLLTLEDENGATVQHSPTTARSSNVDTLALPLENEEVFSIPRQGTYKTTMRISCADDSNISSETRLSYLMFSRETVSP